MAVSDKAVAVIPARLESSRLPRKPLVDIQGQPMILHVVKRCLLAKSLDDVVVATDSEEIKNVVESQGVNVIMTSKDHETGTDRIAEAAVDIDAEIIVNVQGDEALLNPNYLDQVVEVMKDNDDIDCSILVNPFKKQNSPSDIKVVLSQKNDVMYFSRADIPSDARVASPGMLKAYHIVPFRKRFLLEFASLEKGPIERVEFIEFMRILENGYKIRAVHVESDAVSVDTPEDLEFVRQKIVGDEFFGEYS